MNDAPKQTQYISNIQLDERSLAYINADIEHERRVAIFDLLEDNSFDPVDLPVGPYHLFLSIAERRLVFDIRNERDETLKQLILSLAPFRRIIKDYFMICESYFDAIKNASTAQIEAIDMGRRGLHNEGSEILEERLKSKVTVDFNTARRLFTLICVLHINL